MDKIKRCVQFYICVCVSTRRVLGRPMCVYTRGVCVCECMRAHARPYLCFKRHWTRQSGQPSFHAETIMTLYHLRLAILLIQTIGNDSFSFFDSLSDFPQYTQYADPHSVWLSLDNLVTRSRYQTLFAANSSVAKVSFALSKLSSAAFKADSVSDRTIRSTMSVRPRSVCSTQA